MTWSCTKCKSNNHDLTKMCAACGLMKKVVQPGTLPRSIERKLNPGFAAYSLTIHDKEKADMKKALQIFNNIMNSSRGLNKAFIDPDFGHNQTSLGNYRRKDGVVGGKGFVENLAWLRPGKICTSDGSRWKWAVFRDPQPSDIEQGDMGDCWLLTAIALVAKRPDILEQIVLTKEYNPVGVYQLRLCVDGEWKIITIDDFFPSRPRSALLAFAKARKNQLWVPLIEKALAKALGSYEKLNAGSIVEGLSILTGAPCESINLDDKKLCTDTVWARVLSANEAGFIMGCSISHNNKEEYKKKGLVSGHAYSILDVRQEGKYRLIRLHNPWGKFVWNGDWSDNWRGWPAGLRRLLLERDDRGNGTFWMGFADFLAHFDAVKVARLRPSRSGSELRVSVSVGGSFSDEDKSLRISVERDTEVCITLFLSGSRTVQAQIDLMVCVHKVSESDRIRDLVARSPRKNKYSVTTGEIFLRPGHYIIVCHSLSSIGQRSRKYRGMLVVHSNKPLYCEELPCPPQMYSDSLVNLLMKEGETSSVIEGGVLHRLTKDFGGSIMMLENLHEKMYMQIKLECPGSPDVTSSRGTITVADSVPPRHRQILILSSHGTQCIFIQPRISVRIARRPELADWSRLNPNASHFPPFENRDMALLHECKPIYSSRRTN